MRNAREDDYDAIRDVSRQAHKAGYETDYMSGMLAQYMQDKNRLIYVAERNRDKKIVRIWFSIAVFFVLFYI